MRRVRERTRLINGSINDITIIDDEKFDKNCQYSTIKKTICGCCCSVVVLFLLFFRVEGWGSWGSPPLPQEAGDDGHLRLTRITVATYNIWNYNPVWSVRKRRLARLIQDLDVIALQEVRISAPALARLENRFNFSADPSGHQLWELAGETGAKSWKTTEFALATVLEEKLGEGIGLLSRFPAINCSTHQLVSLPSDQDKVKRVCLRCLLQVSRNDLVNVFVVHLSYVKEQQCRQAMEIRRFTLLPEHSPHRVPQIVLGDFNMYTDSPFPLELLTRHRPRMRHPCRREVARQLSNLPQSQAKGVVSLRPAWPATTAGSSQRRLFDESLWMIEPVAATLPDASVPVTLRKPGLGALGCTASVEHEIVIWPSVESRASEWHALDRPLPTDAEQQWLVQRLAQLPTTAPTTDRSNVLALVLKPFQGRVATEISVVPGDIVSVPHDRWHRPSKSPWLNVSLGVDESWGMVPRSCLHLLPTPESVPPPQSASRANNLLVGGNGTSSLQFLVKLRCLAAPSNMWLNIIEKNVTSSRSAVDASGATTSLDNIEAAIQAVVKLKPCDECSKPADPKQRGRRQDVQKQFFTQQLFVMTYVNIEQPGQFLRRTRDQVLKIFDDRHHFVDAWQVVHEGDCSAEGVHCKQGNTFSMLPYRDWQHLVASKPDQRPDLVLFHAKKCFHPTSARLLGTNSDAMSWTDWCAVLWARAHQLWSPASAKQVNTRLQPDLPPRLFLPPKKPSQSLAGLSKRFLVSFFVPGSAWILCWLVFCARNRLFRCCFFSFLLLAFVPLLSTLFHVLKYGNPDDWLPSDHAGLLVEFQFCKN